MSQDNKTVTRNIRTIIGPSTQIVRDTDDVINVDTTLGAVNLTLQNIMGSGLMLNPRCIFINDVGGQVSVNPITVFASGGDIVNNGASVVINSNGANAKCNIANQTEWAISGTGISTSGITGIGTANRVTKFTAPTIIGDSQIFDNGASIGINTPTPNASALLDLVSTDKGLLIPRMTTAQRNLIPSPAISLLIFNVSTGFYEYFDGATWQPIALRNQMPLFADEKQYLNVEKFDKGTTPQGWVIATSSGGTVTYTQASESGVSPGMALLSITTAAASRAVLGCGSGFQYMRTLTDGPETTLFQQLRYNGTPSPSQSANLFGWFNNTGALGASALGNCLAIMYDPTNVSGFNPGLITNLFFIARSNYNGPTANTIVDLGITFDAVTWRSFKITYDNVLGEVRVFRDNILLTTLTNLANVPGGAVRGLIPVGATNGIFAGAYMANNLLAPSASSIRLGKTSVFKRYS